MTASHNALLGAFSRYSHFDELSDPLSYRGNILTPTQRRTLARANLEAASAQALANAAGSGITSGVGAIYKAGVSRVNGVIETRMLLDITGLASSTTDLDIIGVGANPAHIGQVTAAINGTIIGGLMTCLRAPTGGVTDIDLYCATESTGVFDGGIAALTETALITSGAAWTLGLVRPLSAWPAADQYLYLTGGAAGTAATYTAGRFLIQLYGYE